MERDAFDWSLMPAFLAAMDAGSLLAAARRLGQTQPTVGRHIEALERQLGVSLFERTGRGLVPTEAAHRIADSARSMRAAADELRLSLSRATDSLAGTVRVTASQTVAAYLLPPVWVELREQAPGIQIEVLASNEIKNLLQREADIAVRMVAPAQAALIARRIGDLAVHAVASNGYLRRRGAPASPADLANHDLVGFDRDPAILDGSRSIFPGLTRDAFAFRSDDHIACWQAIRHGLGVGFVAAPVAALDPEVRRILPEMALPRLPVWLTAHRELHGASRIRVVFDALARHFERLVTSCE